MARPAGTKQPETKRIATTVTTEVYDAMETLAANQGRTISHLAAFALEYFLAECAPRLYPLSRTVERYHDEPDDDGEDQRNDRSPQETKRQEKSKQS
jgi:hypothetical protein